MLRQDNGIDCGYNTLKFMDDILQAFKNVGVQNIDAVCILRS